MKLQIPSWMEIDWKHFSAVEPTIVSTSGGLTSGLLAALYQAAGAEVQYCFWNTGREALGTYQFLERLADCLPLRCFEILKPAVYGDGPSKMQFQEVSVDKLDKTGKPFNAMLETIADFRRVVKNQDPLGPNPVMRLCTAYMKEKVAWKVAAQIFDGDSWANALGLRADEPRRVGKMTARDTALKTSVAPLFSAGISKCHVEMFWKEQPFTLEIPPHQGNCTLCFLKDEADIADILAHEPDPDGNNWEWWKKVDDQFQIRGRGEAGFRQIEAEAPMRFAIRESLVQIKRLPDRQDFDPKRYKLILRQEEKILRDGRKRTPCSCESAELMTDDFVEKQGCLF